MLTKSGVWQVILVSDFVEVRSAISQLFHACRQVEGAILIGAQQIANAPEIAFKTLVGVPNFQYWFPSTFIPPWSPEPYN
jgi:primosomal protein N'